MLPYFKNRFLLAFAFIVLSNLAFAQKGSVTGTLLDSADHKITLNYATISIFKGTDTVLTSYKLSDDKGIFKVSNLDLGVNYRLVINAWLACLIIALVTAIFSVFGVYLGKKSGTWLEDKAEILGGVVLIAIGIKILLFS